MLCKLPANWEFFYGKKGGEKNMTQRGHSNAGDRGRGRGQSHDGLLRERRRRSEKVADGDGRRGRDGESDSYLGTGRQRKVNRGERW